MICGHSVDFQVPWSAARLLWLSCALRIATARTLQNVANRRGVADAAEPAGDAVGLVLPQHALAGLKCFG
jgi:hypothetical protein